MNTKILIGAFVVIIISGFLYLQTRVPEETLSPVVTLPLDEKNNSYEIEGELVTLVDGYGEKMVAPGSSSKLITRYFGNEVKADFDQDSYEDIAFIVAQDGGGSGTFFYIVAALGVEGGGYLGTNGILLGDRIAPQTTEFKDGEIIVNFADRKEGESYSIMPSDGKSEYFRIKDGRLVVGRYY